MRPMMRINQQVLAYLKPAAETQIKILMARGMDADFAISFLETIMDDKDIYELPIEEEIEQDVYEAG